MNKKLIFFGLIILISISFVYAYTFNDIASGRVSLIDIISGKATVKITCTDSDRGLDYSTYGNVTRCAGKKCYTYRDSCSGTSGKLAEKYCKGSNVATNSYKCPNGCSNGACKRRCSENWQCTEWSTCSNEQQTRTCTDLNNCGTTISIPSLNQSCTSIQCTDSDGGKNYYVRGYVALSDLPTSQYWDSCIYDTDKDIWNLFETYCDNNQVKTETTICPYGCKKEELMMGGSYYGACALNSTNYYTFEIYKDTGVDLSPYNAEFSTATSATTIHLKIGTTNGLILKASGFNTINGKYNTTFGFGDAIDKNTTDIYLYKNGSGNTLLFYKATSVSGSPIRYVGEIYTSNSIINTIKIAQLRNTNFEVYLVGNSTKNQEFIIINSTSNNLPSTDRIQLQLAKDQYGFYGFGTSTNIEEKDELIYQISNSLLSLGTYNGDYLTAYGIVIKNPKTAGYGDNYKFSIPF